MRARVKYGLLVLTLAAVALPACGDDDGSTVESTKTEPDADGDGWPESLDCDDHDFSIFPAADDVPGDGIDQNCSGHDGLGFGGGGGGDAGAGDGGASDPGASIDKDGDGWPASLDCDDDNEGVFPNADEVAYDGIDQDCSGSDLADLDGDGVKGGEAGDDCDDSLASVHPGSLEIALDGVDQDCDGSDLVGTDAFVTLMSDEAAPGGIPFLIAGTSAADKPVVLAAWVDSRVAPRQDIYARFLGEDGKPLGDEFPIDTGGLAKANVRIATNGDAYLVTWDQEDGIWAQQLDESGALQGSLLGIAPVNSLSPAVAWGGANWGIVWTNEAGEVRCRGVSTDGVRSDIHVAATPGFSSQPALAGGDESFLIAWADESGIVARRLDAVAEPQAEQVTVSSEPNVSLPAATRSGGDYLVAFRRSGGSVSVRGQFVSDAFEVADASKSLRLSADSFGVADIFLAPMGSSTFIAWNDDRHRVGVPAYGAIYGNALSDAGAVAWTGDAGMHVDMTAQLGGVATIGKHVLVATRVGSTVGVVVRNEP